MNDRPLESGRAADRSDSPAIRRPWLRTLRPAFLANMTIVCFPHAGAGVLSVARLARSLPDRFGLMVVALPGREPGDTTLPPRRAIVAGSKLAGDIAEHVRHADSTERLVFLGNSYGSLLAFETARSLQTMPDVGLGPDMMRLIVSGFRSPSLPPAEGPIFRLPTEDLFAELAERYGLQPGDLAASGLYEIEEALRADLEACDTFRYANIPLLNHRIDVLHMTQDPTVSCADLRAWQEVTTSPVVITSIEAGHFPWTSHPAAVADAIISLTADF